ncbi:helix-turn-helix transcriptional regulator [Paractinoplanes atraurantiacus]|uniref:Regulatory protein, luxR family n=1 Tax=Paractinoplanes atraurantiacus TaxID=1036182 RepID=A0A285GUM3_9ACTN|nr:LuxR family transcriptional regulator [Actinoplanes atraurantiacus]SNY26001.1 regulatory protein, luxR family [Actinoplanes atraurantiacus]
MVDERMIAFLDAARTRPMFLAVLGEAGIGKSTLLRALGGLAGDRGFHVVTLAPDGFLRALFAGHAPPPAGSARPYEVLRAWSATGRPVPPADEPALVTGMVLALDELAANAPVLILVDRADAADPDSRRLLTSLMRHLSGERVSVVLAARGTEPPPGIGPEITRYVVPPLGEMASARLLGPMTTGPRREALRRAAGNPMALRRFSGGPRWAAQEYARVCAGLPPVTRKLLRQAALAGESEPVDVLTRAAGGTGLQDWEPAEVAGVVTIADGRVRFAHPMFREHIAEPTVQAAYDAGEPSWAVELHRDSPAPVPEAGFALIQLGRPAAALDLARDGILATAPGGAGAMSLAAVAATAVMASGDAGHLRQLPVLLDRVDEGPVASGGAARMLLTGTLAWRWDDSSRAAADLGAVRRAGLREGTPGPVLTALPLLILSLMDTGRWHEAAPLIGEAEKLAAVSGATLLDSMLPALRATLCAWRGESPAPPAPAAGGLAGALGHRAAGLAALAAGEHEAAYESFRAFHDSHPVLGPQALPQLASAAVRIGRTAEARALVAAGRPTSRRTAMLTDHAAAVLDGCEESFRRAIGHVDAGRHWPREHAEAQFAFAVWLRRQRRLRESRPYFQAALDTFQRLGAGPQAEQARRYLPGSGVDGPEPDAILATLPPQKQRIARLAANGLKNIEIARELNVSPRTVSSYLHDIFPQLGVGSRHQLRDLLTANRAG